MFWCVVSLYIFTRCLYFDEPVGLVKILYTTRKNILHTKTSNKIYIFMTADHV